MQKAYALAAYAFYRRNHYEKDFLPAFGLFSCFFLVYAFIIDPVCEKRA